MYMLWKYAMLFFINFDCWGGIEFGTNICPLTVTSKLVCIGDVDLIFVAISDRKTSLQTEMLLMFAGISER